MRTLRSTIFVILVVLLSGCGDKENAASRTKFVEADAQRQCAIQKQTYATSDELNQAYEASLKTSGLTEQEQKRFVDKSEKDKKLRAEIAARFQAICAT